VNGFAKFVFEGLAQNRTLQVLRLTTPFFDQRMTTTTMTTPGFSLSKENKELAVAAVKKSTSLRKFVCSGFEGDDDNDDDYRIDLILTCRRRNWLGRLDGNGNGNDARHKANVFVEVLERYGENKVPVPAIHYLLRNSAFLLEKLVSMASNNAATAAVTTTTTTTTTVESSTNTVDNVSI